MLLWKYGPVLGVDLSIQFESLSSSLEASLQAQFRNLTTLRGGNIWIPLHLHMHSRNEQRVA